MAETTPDGGSNSGDAAESRVSRRRALKVGVGAGVGAAAWAAPQITRRGATPVYAHLCTRPASTYQLGGDRNTACNCGSNPNKYASYKELGSTGANSFPGTVVFKSGSCMGLAVNDSGECPPPGGGAGACIQPTNPNLYCKLRVDVYFQNTGLPAPGSPVFSGIVQGTAFAALPQVPCQGQGAIFVRVSVVCSDHIHCL